jgi:hypothetical protein
MKAHTFGFCILYLTFAFWSQFIAATGLGNVVRVTAATRETPWCKATSVAQARKMRFDVLP